MDLKQAAHEYEKATSEFLTLANSIEEVVLDLTDGHGWSPQYRPIALLLLTRTTPFRDSNSC